MYMGEGRGAEQAAEVKEMNGGYVAMRIMRERLQAKDTTGARANVHEIKAVGIFIDQNLPTLTKEQRSSPDGFYSPAHMMKNATKLVESTISSGEISKATTAADQAMRLMAYGEKASPAVSGGVKEFLPNLVEIPDDWRRSSDGEKFLRYLGIFVESRKQNKPVLEIDFEVLDKCRELITKSYEGAKTDKNKIDTAPYARELILINLSLLNMEAKKYKGTKMPATQDNMDTIQLIRGVFNYNETADVEQRVRHAKSRDLPQVVGQPRALKT